MDLSQRVAGVRPGASGVDRRVLWSRPDLVLWDADWVRDRHAAERASAATIPAFVLLREGTYVKRVGREVAVGDPGSVTLYDAGREVLVSHPRGDRTRGTTFLLGPELAARLRRDEGGAAAPDPAAPFRRLAAPVTPRTHLLYRALVHWLETDPEPDALLAEEAVLALVRRVMRELPDARRPDRRPPTPRARERVAAIQEHVAAHADRTVSLSELGARFDCAPEYVSRVFAQVAGIPLSRWAARLRLARAVERILDGAPSLADVALDAGFAHHSHLTATFAREIGMAPSALRSASARERVLRVLAGSVP